MIKDISVTTKPGEGVEVLAHIKVVEPSVIILVPNCSCTVTQNSLSIEDELDIPVSVKGFLKSTTKRVNYTVFSQANIGVPYYKGSFTITLNVEP